MHGPFASTHPHRSASRSIPAAESHARGKGGNGRIGVPMRRRACSHPVTLSQEITMDHPTRRALLASAAILAAGCLGLSLIAGAQTPAAPYKVGYVYVSPIGDAGWTFQHDTGRKEMEKALGAKVVSKYVENVPEGADAERVIRELAQSG